jgi:hypothetical protein
MTIPAEEQASPSRRKPGSTRTKAVAWPLSAARSHADQGGIASIVDPGLRRDDDLVADGLLSWRARRPRRLMALIHQIKEFT